MSVIIISVCVLKTELELVSDKEAFEPWFTELTTGNPLNFPEYEEKIAKTQEKQDFLRALSSVRQRFTARRQCLV
mgnify:CR=1 FL=1